MTEQQLLEKIKQTKIVPVVVLNSIEETLPKMQALVNGGLPCAEITFRTPCAAEAIALTVKTFPDMLVGAGTVINKEQCEKAIKAGSKFIVSPGFSQEVAACCKKHKMLYLPGIVTPTEAMAAIAEGLTTIKWRLLQRGLPRLNFSLRPTTADLKQSRQSARRSPILKLCLREEFPKRTFLNILHTIKLSPAAEAG